MMNGTRLRDGFVERPKKVLRAEIRNMEERIH
jgi:hypothetical protein